MEIGSSISTLMSLLGKEWSSLMLKSQTLKKNLNTTRKELSQILYQQEAACRVIGKLIKERDQAKEELKKVKETLREGSEIDEELKAEFTNLSDTLASARTSRKPPADLTHEDSIAEFKETASINVHSAAITSLTIAQSNPNLILTGGEDCFARLCDMEEKEVVVNFEHKKKVTAVDLMNNSLNSITCSADGLAHVWKVTSEYAADPFYTVTNHAASITSCSAHPYDNYCVFFSKDGKWSLHDVVKTGLVQAIGVKNLIPITTGKVHPDGLIVTTGLKNGTVILWDIRHQTPTHEFKLHKGTVKRIDFSEKGYQMLTLGKGEAGVRLWDLRKISKEEPVLVKSNDVEIKGTVFDQYGIYFGMCGETVEIYKVKKANKVTEIGKGNYTDLKFGPKNSYIVVGTNNGELKIFN